MPIRPDLRPYYGAYWRRYRARLIEIHGAHCQKCGRECPRYLNLAHRYHNPAASGVVDRLCPGCHARQDARHSYAVRRRTRARALGQGWLSDELEYAAVPLAEVPDSVIEAMQGELF
jgi:hypothetical protein